MRKFMTPAHRDVTDDEFGRHLDAQGQAAILRVLDERTEAGVVLIGATVAVLKELVTGDAPVIVARGSKWQFIAADELHEVTDDELFDVIRWRRRTLRALEVAYKNAVDVAYGEAVSDALANGETDEDVTLPESTGSDITQTSQSEPDEWAVPLRRQQTERTQQ